MPDLDLNRLLNIYFPLAYRQQFQRSQIQGWLDKTLAEHKSWGKVSAEQQMRALQNAMIEKYGGVGGKAAPGQPDPGQYFLDFIMKGVAPGIKTGLQAPAAGYEQKRAESLGALGTGLSSLIAPDAAQGAKGLLPELMAKLASSYGVDVPQELATGVAGRMEKEKEREVRRERIVVDERAVEVRKDNILQMEQNRQTKENELQVRRDAFAVKRLVIDKKTDKRIKLLEKKATRKDKQAINLTKQLNRLDVIKDAEKINPLLDKIEKLNEEYTETSDKIDKLYEEIDEESTRSDYEILRDKLIQGNAQNPGIPREEAERIARARYPDTGRE